MTTDNRTNEQIVDEAMSVQWGRGGWFAGAVVTALEAAGRLVKPNETKSDQAFCFSEVQVEAAAKAIYGDDPTWGYVNDYGYGEVASQWRHLGEGIQEMFRLKARAALVAAQGAAPRAAKDIHEPSHDRVYCVRCGGNWPCQAPQAESEERREFFAEYGRGTAHPSMGAAPVLPSGGVDEDARSLSAWPTVDEVRAQFEKAADRIAFGRMIAEVERSAAEKAWNRCVGEMPIDPDWKNLYSDNNPYRAEAYRREGNQ